MSDSKNQDIFQRLKAICVPLLGSSTLTPAVDKNVTTLLRGLIDILRDVQSAGDVLTPSLSAYVFFPISTILQRNTSTAIPDHILEHLLTILALVFQDWWWDCDLRTWEHCFILSGAVLSGIEGKGKGKERDEETKQAAVECLFSLLHARTVVSHPVPDVNRFIQRAQDRLKQLQQHTSTPRFISIIGQTLDSLLALVQTDRVQLQRIILKVVDALVVLYIPEHLAPSVLPGLVSTMTKVALGVSTHKRWANGDIVAGALNVLKSIISKSLADDICVKEGAVQNVQTLEDLSTSLEESATPDASPNPYLVSRTPSWLRGTSSQIHIALNTLTPLVNHPNPVALLQLSEFSAGILAATTLTLLPSQALLLSFLLSLCNSSQQQVLSSSQTSLAGLLDPSSSARQGLLRTLMQTTRDNLSTLPRILPFHDDAKVEHVAGLIEATCRLGDISISSEIGKLLGPTGGVEKWGWSLLSVVQFLDPPISISQTTAAEFMLESNADTPQWVHFPELNLVHVSSRSTFEALVRMFRALGRAAGDDCLFSVEWFISIAKTGRGTRSVAAMWCACRLLEGASRVSLEPGGTLDSLQHRRSRRLEKIARGLAKSIAELWDIPEDGDAVNEETKEHDDSDTRLPVEFKTGISAAPATLQIIRPTFTGPKRIKQQLMLHKALSLQALSIVAGILQAQYTSLLLHTLYPVLHSLVSPLTHLSSTAFAALNYITISTSYATPANLLLSNFDYALDSVSRRLTRRWLDVDSTKVLVVLVKLVGSDIVDRATDVVEECFDRLDDFHGYPVLVEGLIEVLDQVVRVVKLDKSHMPSDHTDESPTTTQQSSKLDDFVSWFAKRNDTPTEKDTDTTDYGPAPREDWGKASAQEEEQPQSETNPVAEVEFTPTQELTKQIVSRSLYFLTHSSPIIRSRILTMLSSSAAVLPESALMPSIHDAWPFILNRLSDSEVFVVASAATLIESLVVSCGSLMYRRIWDDVWPRFRLMLEDLSKADKTNALSKRGYSAVGTESAYSHSHRLYRSLMRTMTATAKEVDVQDSSVWQVLLGFRRFLSENAHEELQNCARELYMAMSKNNSDAVWLALTATSGATDATSTAFLREPKWPISANVYDINVSQV